MRRPTSLTAAEQSRLRRTSRALGLQTALLVLVCLAVVGAVVVLVVVQGQRESGENRLEAATRSVDDVRDAPAGTWVAIDGQRGLEVSDGMPEGLPDLDVMAEVTRSGTEVRSRVEAAGGTYSVVTAPSRGGAVQVVLDPHEAQEELQRLVAALVVAGGTGVLLAGLGGAWLGWRAVRPTVEALALQRRFVADASHELRTPLTLLSTRAQLLRRHVHAEDAVLSGSPVLSDVDGLLEDTRALTSILEDMLVAADARSVDRSPVDVAEVADAVVAAARATAADRGVDLARTGVTSAVAEVSAVSVRRATTALVDNALDHAAAGVRVDVERTGGMLVLRVEDDGPGIPDAQTDLFGRFASHRPAPAQDGRTHYGLGLALVAEVAAQHGGSVEAGPRADGSHGTVITLRVPVRAPRDR